MSKFRDDSLRCSISQQIRNIRFARGLSAQDVAFSSSLAPANYCRIERGSNNYSIDTLCSVLNTLNLTLKVVDNVSE